MAKKPTLKQRLRYFFDNFMSRGTVALIGGLGLVSLVIIVAAGAVISLGGLPLAPEGSTKPMGFVEAAWESLMRTFDAGTMGSDQGWGFRLVMLFVTIGGILIVSTLIGVLTAGVEGKLDELRKGRSQVLEEGHILILGWSPQIFTILSELMIANENQKKACLVVLADRDKVEMEDEIRARVERRGRTRIICRSGNPIDMTDLEIASPHTAKAIIILPPEDEDPDSQVIKTILALTNHPERRPEPYHIVTQIRDPPNMEVVRMIGSRDQVQAILTGELIARLTAQTSRQSGLSVVYTELMNFGGDEIYFKEEPLLVGKTFAEALLQFEDSAVIGLCFADGSVTLNPPMETRLAPGDQVIAISEDDDTIHLHHLETIPIDAQAIAAAAAPRPARPEKCLILGWNACAPTIIRELDHYVPKGSQVLVVADARLSPEAASAGEDLRRRLKDLKNQRLAFQHGDTTDRAFLDELEAAEYDHIIVLSYDGLDVQRADAKTLVTLLHLRSIAETDETPFSIVSEMMDLRNRELAEATRVDDFIVSDHFVSLMMAQLAENPALMPVFGDIFDPEGSEIYLKPAGEYVALGRPVNFYTVVEAAARRGQVAFGYRLAAEAAVKEKSYGVHTNPAKSEEVVFAENDRIIVLAEG
ncbi:MAG: potassium transporter TrkA [Anaerolineales bacterium]